MSKQGESIMIIRPGNSDDVESLADLVKAHFAYQQQFDAELHVEPDLSWPQYVKELLTRRNGQVFVADNNGELVGYVSILEIGGKSTRRLGWSFKDVARRLIDLIRPAGVRIISPRHYGFIEDIYVDELVRHTYGVGASLLGECMQWFSDRGVDHVEATVDADNVAGLSFFKRSGFEHRKVLVRKRL